MQYNQPIQRDLKFESRKASFLPKALRVCGVLVLLISMFIFMVQGIEHMSPLLRHWASLGLTGVMAVVGFLCLRQLEEKNGARTFLTLATAMVPVHFSQLGAMTYSFFSDGPSEMPAVFSYAATGASSILLNSLATAAIAIPLSMLGFALLSRQKYQQMTMWYMIINAALLIPLRMPVLMLGIATIQILLAEYVEKTMVSTHFTSRRYSVINRTLLWLPPLIVLGRGCFYDPDPTYFAYIFAVAGYLFLHAIPKAGINWLNEGSRLHGVASLCLAWGIISSDLLLPSGREQLFPLIIMLPMALICFYGSYLSQTLKGFLHIVGLGTVLISLLALVACDAGSLTIAAAGMASGAALLWQGWRTQNHATVIAGAMGMLIGVVALGYLVINFYTSHSWIALALSGIAILLSASLIEKRADRLQLVWQQMRLW